MSKEKRSTEVKGKDPVFTDDTFMYNNMLALPDTLKTYLTAQGLDWRFLNAKEFRGAGGYHRSHWQPLKITTEMGDLGLSAVTAEGLIQRGDLILGVRTKAVTAKHKEFLAEKNRRYSQFNKNAADEMRSTIRSKGLSGVKVDESMNDGEEGFN